MTWWSPQNTGVEELRLHYEQKHRDRDRDTHTHTHTHTHIHTYIHTHTHIHTYTYTHVHTLTHTYTHTHSFLVFMQLRCYCCILIGSMMGLMNRSSIYKSCWCRTWADQATLTYPTIPLCLSSCMQLWTWTSKWCAQVVCFLLYHPAVLCRTPEAEHLLKPLVSLLPVSTLNVSLPYWYWKRFHH